MSRVLAEVRAMKQSFRVRLLRLVDRIRVPWFSWRRR